MNDEIKTITLELYEIRIEMKTRFDSLDRTLDRIPEVVNKETCHHVDIYKERTRSFNIAIIAFVIFITIFAISSSAIAVYRGVAASTASTIIGLTNIEKR